MCFLARDSVCGFLRARDRVHGGVAGFLNGTSVHPLGNLSALGRGLQGLVGNEIELSKSKATKLATWNLRNIHAKSGIRETTCLVFYTHVCVDGEERRWGKLQLSLITEQIEVRRVREQDEAVRSLQMQ